MTKNKQNVPQVRFKGFTDDWEQREVGDVLSESRDAGHSGDIAKKLTVKLWGKGVYAKNDKGSAATQYFTRHAGQFIYSKLDFLNSAFGVVPQELESYESTADLPAFDCVGVDPFFMFYRAIQPSFYLTNGMIADGSRKAKRIHVETFLDMPLDLPSIEEQKKVASYFTQLDNLITLHQRKCETLQKLKKSMLQKMFPKNGSHFPEIRFKGFTDAWEQRELDELVEFYSGLTYKPEDVTENGTLVLRSSNVKNSEIVLTDNVYVDESVVNSDNVKKDDIIVVVRNGSKALIGKHAKIRHSMPNTVIGAFMTGVRSDSPDFINALLSTEMFDKEIKMNMGATINQITGYMFANMEFMTPSFQERQAVGSFFSRLDNLITLHQRKLETLKKLKKAMLQKMFI